MNLELVSGSSSNVTPFDNAYFVLPGVSKDTTIQLQAPTGNAFAWNEGGTITFNYANANSDKIITIQSSTYTFRGSNELVRLRRGDSVTFVRSTGNAVALQRIVSEVSSNYF